MPKFMKQKLEITETIEITELPYYEPEVMVPPPRGNWLPLGNGNYQKASHRSDG